MLWMWFLTVAGLLVRAPSPWRSRAPGAWCSPPEHARVIALVPDCPPAWISWRGGKANIICGYGPERIAAPWWDQTRQRGNKATRQQDKSDKGNTSPNHHIATSPYLQSDTRDYFVIQTEHGQWLWMYRECASGEWFVHGEWN